MTEVFVVPKEKERIAATPAQREWIRAGVLLCFCYRGILSHRSTISMFLFHSLTCEPTCPIVSFMLEINQNNIESDHQNAPL